MDRNPRTPYPLSQKDEPFPPGAPRERRVGLSTLSADLPYSPSFLNNLSTKTIYEVAGGCGRHGVCGRTS